MTIVKDELTDKIAVDLAAYEGMGVHHSKTQFGYLSVCGMITGCGLGQLFGVTYLKGMSKEKQDNIMAEIKAYCKKTGIGTLLCTLGTTTFDSEPLVLEKGFTLVREYPNEKHIKLGYPTHTQRLYILTL